VFISLILFFGGFYVIWFYVPTSTQPIACLVDVVLIAVIMITGRILENKSKKQKINVIDVQSGKKYQR